MYCGVALIVAITSSILIILWVIQPLIKLNLAVKDIALGQWNKTVNIDRSDVIEQLAKSFNKMVKQLQESFKTLEDKVKERTAQLATAQALLGLWCIWYQAQLFAIL